MNFINNRLVHTAFRVTFLFVLCTFFLCNKSDALTYTITDIGALNGNFSFALDINNHSQVTGYSGSPSKVILYDNATLINLGGLAPQRPAFGQSINNLGQITGEAYTADNKYRHAFFYNGTTMQDLGTLGGNESWGRGINNFGRVVGYSDLGDFTRRGFIYDGTTMHALGTLGGNDSRANAISNSGLITGSADTTSLGYAHAFIYDGRRCRI